MSKFQKLKQPGPPTYIFYCPGCELHHFVRVGGPSPTWRLTGVEDDKPTVKPSIRVRYGESLCHSFVTDGKIQFLGDCTHKMANQTVEIPDFDDEAIS